MKEYKLVRASSSTDLEKNVNNALKDGWKPQGGVAITAVPLENKNKSQAILIQAMVKL